MEMFYSFTVVVVTQMYAFVKYHQRYLKREFVLYVKSNQENKLIKKIGIKMVAFPVYLTETTKIYSGKRLKMKMELQLEIIKHTEK